MGEMVQTRLQDSKAPREKGGKVKGMMSDQKDMRQHST